MTITGLRQQIYENAGLAFPALATDNIGSYNGNIPSIISDPTPIVKQPTMSAQPPVTKVDVTIPASTSQITPTASPAPSATVQSGSIPASNTKVTSSDFFLILGAIAAVIGIYFIWKKYK